MIDGDKESYTEKGELQFSDVSVNETTGTVELRALFPNPKHELLPGLFVRAKLDQVTEPNAILMPQVALIRNPDNSTMVWIVGSNNKVAMRPIKVSQAIGDNWIVSEGLSAGDKVVVEGIQKIQPDMVVVAVEKKDNATSNAPVNNDKPVEPKKKLFKVG